MPPKPVSSPLINAPGSCRLQSASDSGKGFCERKRFTGVPFVERCRVVIKQPNRTYQKCSREKVGVGPLTFRSTRSNTKGSPLRSQIVLVIVATSLLSTSDRMGSLPKNALFREPILELGLGSYKRSLAMCFLFCSSGVRVDLRTYCTTVVDLRREREAELVGGRTAAARRSPSCRRSNSGPL